ncbi:hypothetical protein M758_2G185100 [Ceratodon purpureus]|nr:hypothetical protein M758_2G185100 [Ceratodon purpureus]
MATVDAIWRVGELPLGETGRWKWCVMQIMAIEEVVVSTTLSRSTRMMGVAPLHYSGMGCLASRNIWTLKTPALFFFSKSGL